MSGHSSDRFTVHPSRWKVASGGYEIGWIVYREHGYAGGFTGSTHATVTGDTLDECVARLQKRFDKQLKKARTLAEKRRKLFRERQRQIRQRLDLPPTSETGASE